MLLALIGFYIFSPKLNLLIAFDDWNICNLCTWTLKLRNIYSVDSKMHYEVSSTKHKINRIFIFFCKNAGLFTFKITLFFFNYHSNNETCNYSTNYSRLFPSEFLYQIWSYLRLIVPVTCRYNILRCAFWN